MDEAITRIAAGAPERDRHRRYDAYDREREAILKVIAAETDAYLRKDFDEWASYWVHGPDTMRMHAFAGRGAWVHRGWDHVAPPMKVAMTEYPDPSPSLGRIERWDVRVTVGGDMAWVYYDQIGPETGDAFQMHHLQYELKVLQKVEGRWLLAAVAVLQQSRDLADCPLIEMEAGGKVLWMNDKARRQSATHPGLIVSGGRLRARHRASGPLLEAAIAEAVAHRIGSLACSRPGSLAVPVALSNEDGNGISVCWIGQSDYSIVATFDDDLQVTRRLEVAASIFGLSKAQTALCRLIVDGNDLAGAAEALGVTVNTARTHLQRVFDKTGERSQAALVRALMSVVPPE